MASTHYWGGRRITGCCTKVGTNTDPGFEDGTAVG